MNFPATIFIRDMNGANTFMFLKIADDRYFGGTVNDNIRNLVPGAHGPHEWKTLGALLDLIAQIANLPDPGLFCYSIYGCDDHTVPIMRQMYGQVLADALGCKREDITEHFENLVKII